MSEQFGHYVLETLIGRGGMGEVYRAYDTDKDRVVALKRLPKDLVADEVFEARFRRECRLAARLNEPHVIPIHDFGEIEGHLYLDMRLVEGVDLSAVIHDGGRMNPKVAVDIVGQVGSALQAAHAAGLVHRDIKPSNILVTGLPDDPDNVFAYLVDFGIARSEAGGTALTSTTGTVGTLGYMAPERISGRDGDSRSDIYSLACVLFECLTGHSPYKGETFQVMFAHVNAPPPIPSVEVAGLPRRLDDVIRRGLAKDPDQRYQTANQFSAAARAALSDAGVTPPLPGGAPRMPPPPPGASPRPPFTGPPAGGQGGYGPGYSGPPQNRPPAQPQYPAAYGGPGSAPFTPRPDSPQGTPPGGVPPYGPRSGPQALPNQGPPNRPPSGPQPSGATSGPLPGSRPGQTSGPVSTGPTSGPLPPGAAAATRAASGPTFDAAGAPPRGPSSGPVGSPGPGPGPVGFGAAAPPRGPVTGPPPPPGARPPGRGGGVLSSRRNLIALAAALVAVIVAVIVIVSVSGGSSSPQAGGTTSTSRSASSSASSSTTPSPSPSVSGLPAGASWSNYSDFTDLIGAKPGDTAGAYRGATCSLEPPDTTVTGMIDQVACVNLTGSKVEFYVARFANAADVTAYGSGLVSEHNYTKQYWTLTSQNRGLLYEAPSTETFADVTTSICGLPTFLVQFYAPTTADGTTQSVLANYWKPAHFPNATPPVCGS